MPQSSEPPCDEGVLLADGQPVTIQVGERRFATTKETLIQSPFFEALLSEPWNAVQPGGSFFVDADPDLFEHVLRYLRRGIFPLFYDSVKGHDHALYFALQVEADYFLLPKLADWLRKGEYLNAVKTRYVMTENDGLEGATIQGSGSQVEIQRLQKRKNVYICPCHIPTHSAPHDCGRRCKKARGVSGQPKYEERDVWITLIIRKETLVDQNCGI